VKNFAWTRFSAGNIFVRCITEKSAKNFVKECCKHGIYWCGIDPKEQNMETYWSVHEDDTCYKCSNGDLQYGNYRNTIVEWKPRTYKDVFLEQFPNARLNKSGGVKVCRYNIFGGDTKSIECHLIECAVCWNQEYKEE